MQGLPPARGPAFGRLLSESHRQVVGEPLLPPDLLVAGPGAGSVPASDADAVAARWLYEAAPFALLVHDTAPDPVFVYANTTAQRVFEYTWDEFVGLPSRLSAEAPNRSERQEFMAEVLSRGFVPDYRGRRIAKSGRRFWIEGATVWNVLDGDGVLRGQAAMIRRVVTLGPASRQGPGRPGPAHG